MNIDLHDIERRALEFGLEVGATLWALGYIARGTVRSIINLGKVFK